VLSRRSNPRLSPTMCRMTTQDSITIQELVENRTEEVFPYGFPFGFPLRKSLSQTERKRSAAQKTQFWTRAKSRKVRERPHLVRLSAAQETVGSLPHFLKAACPRHKSKLNTLHGNLHDSRQDERRENLIALRPEPPKRVVLLAARRKHLRRAIRPGIGKKVTITLFTFLMADFFPEQVR
jgi:hypothetical protein